MHELLVVDVGFSDLGIVKIEVEHHVPGLDNLLTLLEERRPSNQDVLMYFKRYIQEIGAPAISRPLRWIHPW